MRGKVFTLASVALLSCRAVLGIEELDDPTADGGTGTDGGTDAASDSARTDADTGTPGTDSGGDAGLCFGKTGMECGKCCRDSNQQGNKELEVALGKCLCDGGCGTNACAGTTVCGGATEPKDSQCIPCVDTTIKMSSCPMGANECAKSAGCKVVYDCLASCK